MHAVHEEEPGLDEEGMLALALNLRQMADWLPFQAQAFIPLSLYMGQVPPQGVAGALGLQLAWVAALFGIAWLVWQRAMRRVIIQGG